eukprot:3525186-Rhodomonas_salina.4
MSKPRVHSAILPDCQCAEITGATSEKAIGLEVLGASLSTSGVADANRFLLIILYSCVQGLFASAAQPALKTHISRRSLPGAG